MQQVKSRSLCIVLLKMKKLKKGFARGKSCAIIVLYVKKRRIKVSVERRFDLRYTESVFCLQAARVKNRVNTQASAVPAAVRVLSR